MSSYSTQSEIITTYHHRTCIATPAITKSSNKRAVCPRPVRENYNISLIRATHGGKRIRSLDVERMYIWSGSRLVEGRSVHTIVECSGQGILAPGRRSLPLSSSQPPDRSAGMESTRASLQLAAVEQLRGRHGQERERERERGGGGGGGGKRRKRTTSGHGWGQCRYERTMAWKR